MASLASLMFPCRRHLKANSVGNGLHVLRKSGGTGATAERIQEIMEPRVERPVIFKFFFMPLAQQCCCALPATSTTLPPVGGLSARCRLYSYVSVTHVRLRSARPILLLASMSSSDELTISGHKRSKSARASAITPCSRSLATRFLRLRSLNRKEGAMRTISVEHGNSLLR